MIKIICVGKIKETYWKDAITEYLKRLSKYTKVEIVEVSDCALDHIPTILEKERDLINKNIGDKDYVVTMEIEGNLLTSIEFSKKIESIMNINSNLTFIIGGSYGIHEDIKKRANYTLSFSKLTFPHQLFRVILLEQIYRAYKIKNHESYHK